MKKPRKPASQAAESFDSIVNSTYDATARYLRDEISRIIAGDAGESKIDPAYRAATLTKLLSQVASEQRKADKEARKQFDSYTHAGVLAWARALTRDEQQRIARDIAAMAAEGNILA